MITSFPLLFNIFSSTFSSAFHGYFKHSSVSSSLRGTLLLPFIRGPRLPLHEENGSPPKGIPSTNLPGHYPFSPQLETESFCSAPSPYVLESILSHLLRSPTLFIIPSLFSTLPLKWVFPITFKI